MGLVFGIYSGAGNYFSVKRVLFSPVPGLFFGEQPAYHYTNHDHYI
jgi:hypothetical protein